MKNFIERHSSLSALGLVMLCGLSALTLSVGGATLADFGYQNMRINGRLPAPSRPLLVILADFYGTNLAHNAAYYHELVFSLSRRPGINAYFREVSNDRFVWAPGGTIGPIRFTLEERWDVINNDGRYAANIVERAMTSGLFNFAAYDVNSDGQVSQDELQIMVISNDGDGSGAKRWAGCVRPSGFSYEVCACVALVNQRTDFATLCHELMHTLGALDLYGQGCLSQNLTLMGCTLTWPENPETYHLDPWHKMQLGWCEPRIHSLRQGGIESIPAAHAFDSTAPIILHDPSRSTSEFFMLEYRARSSPSSPSYDQNVAGNGVAIWRVAQGANRGALYVPLFQNNTIPGQGNWRWCSKCQGLHHVGDAVAVSLRPCPESTTHAGESSHYYVVHNDASAPGQPDWRWCRKCSGLFHGPNESVSRCIVGGTHDGSASGNYTLRQNDTTAPGQPDWNWCFKCQGLFYGPNQPDSDCPAGSTHDGSASGNYTINKGVQWAVWSEGEPDFPFGGNAVWRSNSTTPYLRWLNGEATRTRIHVRPFAHEGPSATVEWLTEEDAWVDFAYSGIELGLFNFPFNTLAEGTAGVPRGGFLKIKTGSTAETMTISKRMTIQAFGGPVTIGR